eukprot:375499_1
MTEQEEWKVVVLGGGGTGKEELRISPPKDKGYNFLEQYDPTIEDSYRTPCLVDDKPCLVDLLDTAGDAEFSSMQDQWMQEANVFMIVYSITSRSTFDEAVIMREKILRCKEEEEPPIVLVGNKCHLEDQRQISKSEGEQLVSEWSGYSSFLEISTAERINCKECIYEGIRLARQQKQDTFIQERAAKLKFTKVEKQTCCIIL